ncbi:lipoprotein precursor [Bordetella ansorpii]|uniref:LPS-assembly lipoprotein LptE n=1 Tax=Bordetella ansorpii TaxID=288768 RepID=A0A157SPG0_9BORD|nr:LPS assembly lipoprotein LptE [Bordetella ansorpii]SAI72388.1 lipoprotein precursor [Bordetella ansorpii]
MNHARLAPSRPFSRPLLRAAGLALVLLLSACGFQMRGETPLPFDTLYVTIPDNTKFGADVRRSLRAASPNTRLTTTGKEAQAILQQVGDARGLREVSLNAQGRVEEYELSINFTFRLIDAKGNAIIPDTTLTAYQQMPYDDQVMQAKEDQMNMLYENMQQSLVNRLLRRLTSQDVRDAAARLKQGVDDPNAPVYDPNAAQAMPDVPYPMRSPSVNDARQRY